MAREPGFFTLGFQRGDTSALLGLLAAHSVRRLIDVRWLPSVQWRPDLAKKNLAQTLAQNGIGYAHIRELGSPPNVRKRLKETGDFQSFEQEYGRHAATQQDALKRLVALVEERPSVLFCKETDWRECHRKVLTELLEGHGFAATHL